VIDKGGWKITGSEYVTCTWFSIAQWSHQTSDYCNFLPWYQWLYTEI